MGSGRKYDITIGDNTYEVEFVSRDAHFVTFQVGGKEYTAHVSPQQIGMASNGAGLVAPTGATAPKSTPVASGSPDVVAPMPGLVVSVAVEEGQSVSAGDQALVLEAMKMENAVPFGKDGTVKKIHVTKGDQVESGQMLIEVE